MACGDVLSLEDLQTAKKHQIFEAEVITGKAGGVAGGATIGTATNPVTGQTQQTLPSILADLGFDVQSWTSSTGGVLASANQVFMNDTSGSLGLGDYYAWGGTFPKTVPAGTDPALVGSGYIMRSSRLAGVQAREALRRSYAEVGLNLVAGSFEAGGALVNANDVLLQERTGKAFSGPAGAVAAGTDPTIGGFVDRSYVRSSVYVGDFVNFSANHTAALQSAIEQAKLLNAGRIILPNQTLNLICNESGAFSFAASVVFDGLHNCDIVGAGPLSELRAATGGTGAAAFALGRIQNCTNLTFSEFKVNGDYANHPGDAGSRSVGFILITFDRQSTLVDLGPLRNIHFKKIECNDAAGFIWGVRRADSQPYANPIYGVVVEDCFGHDAAQANNTIGFSFVIGGSVKRNRFTNTATINPYPSLFIDVSRGCRDIDVEHNYGRMFVFGMKSEGHVAGGAYAVSDNINFRHNILEEIGDPNSFSGGSGAGAGNTYAYKIRSENSECEFNTWTPRTELVTTGGLYSGVYVEQNETLLGINNVHDNSGFGARYGIIHNKTLSDNMTTCLIHHNKVSATLKGILFQADCDVDDNQIHNTPSVAVDMQISNNSRARRNRAYNCSSSGSAVFNQGGAGATVGYFEFLDNEILDTRGPTAATYGYNLASGLVYTNRYRINKGVYSGLLGSVYAGEYIGLFSDNDVKFSGQVNGSTLAVTLGYNILNVTSVDANTIQINFKRAIPADAFLVPTVVPLTGGAFTVPFGATVNYYRVRFVTSAGVVAAPSSINIRAV